MHYDISEKEAELIKRRRARLAGQARQPAVCSSRLGAALNIVLTIGVFLLIACGVIMTLDHFGWLGGAIAAPPAAPATAAPLPTAAYVAPAPSQEVLRTSVEDNQVQQLAQSTTVPAATQAPSSGQAAQQPAAAPTAVPATEQPAVTIDHLARYPAPTSTLSQAELDAAAASEEQMMLRRECQALTEAQCDAQAAAAGNDIRITLAQTPQAP